MTLVNTNLIWYKIWNAYLQSFIQFQPDNLRQQISRKFTNITTTINLDNIQESEDDFQNQLLEFKNNYRGIIVQFHYV